MIRHLFVVSAFAATAFAVVPAGAQDATTTPGMAAPAPDGMFFTMPTPATPAFLASTLMGEPVYNSTAEGAQAIGEVKDFIVAEDGSIDAVIVSVGGFLGVGEKDVAVNFTNLAWATTAMSDQRPVLVVNASSDQLNAAPAFDTAAFAAVAPSGAAMPADTTAMTAAPNAATGTLPTDMVNVEPSSISAEDLMGTAVYSAENENVGNVRDVILNQDGTIDAVVLDIGGFLGIGQKPVAIAFEGLGVRRDQSGGLYVYTAFTRQQLEAAPDYAQDRYQTERDTMRLGSS